MADTSFGITAGSGTLLHTATTSIGGSTVHDQVVKLGDQYLATYAFSPGGTSTATAASHLLQIMAGSTLRVQLRRLIVYQSVAVTTAALIPFAVVRLTTAGTGGTTATARPYDPADAAAGATAMTLPTAKGTEGSSLWFGHAYMMQTISASAPGITPLLDLDFDRLGTKPIIIAAGTANGIAFTNISAAAGGSVNVWALLTEANF